jgi:hypothetical protein
MDNPPIPPALTPLDWANASEGHEVGGRQFTARISRQDMQLFTAEDPELDEGDRHALAALCLHEQTFGFSHEDVVALLDAATSIEEEWPEEHQKWQDVPRLRSIASRLAALLPPAP